MTRTIGFLFSILILVVTSATGALAEKRVALVIGNSKYDRTVSLPNPVNDAEAMANVLRHIGFSVTKVNDLSFDGMRRSLRDFSDVASKADTALVFYAGHGMEVNKQNYLIPVDARLETDRDIAFEAVALDLIMNAVSGAKKLRLVMLDACRNNPFAVKMKRTSATRSIGRGLARIEPTTGTLVSYAAKEGTVAEDGNDQNSPYTKALLRHLVEPGLDIQFLFRKVRDSVLASTNGQQEPFTYGSLPGRQIFLVKPTTAPGFATAPTPLSSGTVTQNGPSTIDLEVLFWSSVMNSNDPKIVQTYLDKFPTGLFARLARSKLTDLQQAAISRPAIDPAVDRQPAARPITDPVAGQQVADQQPDGKEIHARSFKAYKNKDYRQAMKLAREAAGKGYARAMVSVGFLYEKGRGASRNYAEAIRWYRKAAASGEHKAMRNMGVMYSKGLGVDRNFAEAARWYRKAADRGNADAMFYLGRMYDKGRGVTRDTRKAVQLFARAIKAGSKASLKNITTNPQSWSRGFRLELQRKLRDEGVYAGAIDASVGPATTRAVQRLAAK
ncbi:MAG: caspase family protein [Aestuariivirgaceae bacterium]